MSDDLDPFPTTRWSLVWKANRNDSESAKALDDLCRAYWKPLMKAVQRMGCAPHETEDFVQGFFLKVIDKDLFSRTCPQKGKLRAFLQTAFRHHMQDEWSRRQAKKRGGGIEMLPLDETHLSSQWEAETKLFDHDWAERLIECSLDRLQVNYAKENQLPVFTGLRPFLTCEPEPEVIHELAERLGLSPGSARVAWHRLRKRFAEALRSEVEETLGPGEDVEAELRYLLSVTASE